MSNENWLIYPTVDLFVYDLADGIGQNEDKISQNRAQFWQKIYGDKTESQLESLKQAESETAEYIELLGDKKFAAFESPLDGYAYPVKIGDTYAAQFDLSGKREPDADKKFAPKEIDCLEWLQQQVISRVNPPPTIGQSWLVWGQLTADDQDALTTAKNCYTKLNLFPNPKWDRDLKAEGKILEANFYELWLPPGDRGNIGQNYHVLICLFPYNNGQSIADISNTVAKLYVDLIRLFAYRNKVIWAYTQSRKLKTDLKDAARTIQQIVSQLPQQVNAPKVDLKELQQSLVDSLTIFSSYANYISRLEEQENTIKTNLKNYKRRLKTIGEKMGNDVEAFKFMASFSDFAKEKYVWQVEADNRGLSAGLRLLENAIETIEGIIEIERAKSDRTLNVTIGAVGVGMATSGVAASVYAGQIKSSQNLDVNVVFGLSIVLGMVAGAIALIAIRRKWR
jgi:acetolactate synthase small subunit